MEVRTISKQVKYLQFLHQAAKVQIAYDKARTFRTLLTKSRDLLQKCGNQNDYSRIQNDYLNSSVSRSVPFRPVQRERVSATVVQIAYETITPIAITPEGPTWNPNTDVYSKNEECFMDWEGNMVEVKDRQTVLVGDEDIPFAHSSEAAIMSAMASTEVEHSIYTEEELKRIYAVVSSVLVRLKVPSVKFGVRIPSNIDGAKALGGINGNTLWQDAIAKEMTNVSIAFEILSDDQPIPKGWTPSSGHLVFTVEMDPTWKGLHIGTQGEEGQSSGGDPAMHS